jgi:2,3,4,5-tetrahydropyridine-2,6-dicarboxylate N-succinyltransferase
MLNTYEPAQIAEIQERVGYLHSLPTDQLRQEQGAKDSFFQFCELLNLGVIRSAQKDDQGVWNTNAWVKEGILMGMRLGTVEVASREGETLQFIDKDTLPLQNIDLSNKVVRVVPGGTSIRNGAFIGDGVIVMPPSYINIGAYVGEGTMIDFGALVGSCAQVGKRCHISASALIGGVLEPANASPCIVEDNVFMGMHTSIAEGVRVLSGAILGQGTKINRSTPIYDMVTGKIHVPVNGILTVPENAVVIPGSRAIRCSAVEILYARFLNLIAPNKFPIAGKVFAALHGLSIDTPIIVKYRDPSHDAKLALEDILRESKIKL